MKEELDLAHQVGKESVNILCIADDNYAPYCGIMLTSLFENNKDKDIRVYLLSRDNLGKRNVDRIVLLCKRYGFQFNVITVDDSFFKQFSLIDSNQTMAITTFYRLYAAELLPEEVHKVLYLDDDIIVTGNLSKLWEMDLSDKGVAVAPDVITFDTDRPTVLNYPENAGYFNAGVMLINLDYWRTKGIGPQCLIFLEKHHSLLKYFDQDVLNAVLWNRKINLPLTYNFQISFLSKDHFKSLPLQTQKEIMEEQDTPIIIHYSDFMKPWMLLYYKRPYLKMWKKYKKLSPWRRTRDILPPRKVFNWFVKRYVLWPAGLMRYDSDYIIEK